MRIAVYGTTHSGRKELVDNLVAMFPDSKVDVIPSQRLSPALPMVRIRHGGGTMERGQVPWHRP